jgi:hypothetical protein
MINNRNRLWAILVTAVGVAFIAGWLGVAFLLPDPTTNVGSEIVRQGVGSSASPSAVGTKIPLIAGVSLTITTVRWSSSIPHNSANVLRPAPFTLTESFSPSDPRFRFLVVDYEIINGSEKMLKCDGLAAMFQVTNGGVRVSDGMDFDTLLYKGKFSYGATTDERLLDIPPTLTYNGRWLFEVDFRSPTLRLTNELIDFDLLLPEDVRREPEA